MTPFRRLLLAQAISLLGDLLAVFAVQSAIVFHMRGTAAEASGVFLSALIPTIFLGPFAGVWCDRWPPRCTMIVSDVVRALLICTLMFAGSLKQIYVVSFLMSSCAAFFQPSFSIAFPLLVPKQRLLISSARLQQTMQCVRLIGPAIAGALAARFGEKICYAADALSFLASAMLIASLNLNKAVTEARKASASKGLGADLRHGIAFIRETPAVTSVFSAVVVTTFASSCYGVLTPVYVRDLLHGHSATFGMVGVFAGAGTLAGAFACEGLARRHVPASRFMPVGMAMLTVAFGAIALAPMRSVLLAATAAAGFSGALIAAASRTVLARQTPICLRGRVNSMVSMFTGVAQGAGFGLAGLLVHPLGIRGVLLMCALALGAVWTLRPAKSCSSAHQQK